MVGVGIVGAVAYAGFVHRSPMIIGPLGVAFAVMFVVGKPSFFRQSGLGKMLLGALMVLPVQLVLVTVFYLVGYGAGSLFDGERTMAPFSQGDWVFAGWVLVVGGLLGAVASVLELRSGMPSLDLEPEEFARELMRKHGFDFDEDEEDDDASDVWSQSAADSSITPTTIFDLERSGEVAPGATGAEIIAAETRLGLRLPKALRLAYAFRNGGATGFLVVPTLNASEPGPDDYRSAFVNEWLVKLERISTLGAHPEAPSHAHSPETEELLADSESVLVLAASDAQFTLLDYSTSDEPKVFVQSFDPLGEPELNVTFETFNAFMSSMVRLED